MKKIKKRYIGFGVVLIALVVSFFFDNTILGFFNLIHNNFLDYIMRWISDIGSVVVVMIFMTTLFLWEGRKREYIFPMWLSFISTTVVVYLTKIITARPRPVMDTFPLFAWFAYSFPSAHTAIAFSVLPILDKELPKFKWFWLGFAVLVGFSRVYLQVHYLSDVIAGGLIGYLFGYAFLKYEKTRRPFKRIFQ
ncbi:phosphatase PAP2 family protein [Candidatus Woesearchaeota archaeon]|nr:phosphatase PAP2 family protein [Candidatus Woesearchaeota archaeon]